MAGRKALGKGLSALLGVTEGSAPLEKIYRVGIGEIRPDPDQPRREMDGEGLESLAASIRVHGVLQPLLLRLNLPPYSSFRDSFALNQKH